MSPCPPSPSHHAVLGGRALLHGVFEQHVALRVTETHPARPPQPAGSRGVSKDPLPSPLLSSSLGTGVHWGGYTGVCPAIWCGQEKDDDPQGALPTRAQAGPALWSCWVPAQHGCPGLSCSGAVPNWHRAGGGFHAEKGSRAELSGPL